MNKYKTQKNSGSASSSQDGFTIVEAMVAIFILTVSVSSMLGITASSAASARYANNETTANYLLQEAVDSIRNSRDTIAFQMKATNEIAGTAWTAFLNRYGFSGNNKCFSTYGCNLQIEDFDVSGINNSDVISCPSSGCIPLKYDESAKLFYNYTSGSDSSFTRKVNMKINPDNPDEVKVTAKIEWLNGDATVPRTQTLTTYLLNWQK